MIELVRFVGREDGTTSDHKVVNEPRQLRTDRDRLATMGYRLVGIRRQCCGCTVHYARVRDDNTVGTVWADYSAQ